jgi:hypothetical protein
MVALGLGAGCERTGSSPSFRWSASVAARVGVLTLAWRASTDRFIASRPERALGADVDQALIEVAGLPRRRRVIQRGE